MTTFVLKQGIFFIIISLFAAYLSASEQSAAIQEYSEQLKTHVQNGSVNYAKLCKDPRLNLFIQDLAKSKPSSTSNEALSYWINAYNAYTLYAICEKYPVKSINNLNEPGLTIWDKAFVNAGGEKTTLNYIEHTIIRKQFKEPRIHFALVCASKSCPALRAEAFEASRLIDQLEDQARTFFNDPSRNYFDRKTRTAKLSKILDWYSIDFGKTPREVLVYCARFLPQELAADILQNQEKWQISYLNYDWSLNE